MIGGEDGETRLWHTGGTNGQNAVLTVVPGHQLTLGMMTNGDKGTALHDRFNKAVLRDFCGIVIAEPRVIESSAEELAQYEGFYVGMMREIHLRMENGALLADIRMVRPWPADQAATDQPPATAARCGDDQLLILDGDHKKTRADIIRDDSGEILYLRFGSRLHVRQ